MWLNVSLVLKKLLHFYGLLCLRPLSCHLYSSANVAALCNGSELHTPLESFAEAFSREIIYPFSFFCICQGAKPQGVVAHICQVCMDWHPFQALLFISRRLLTEHISLRLHNILRLSCRFLSYVIQTNGNRLVECYLKTVAF